LITYFEKFIDKPKHDLWKYCYSKEFAEILIKHKWPINVETLHKGNYKVKKEWFADIKKDEFAHDIELLLIGDEKPKESIIKPDEKCVIM
jgi:hypothetical protein